MIEEKSDLSWLCDWKQSFELIEETLNMEKNSLKFTLFQEEENLAASQDSTTKMRVVGIRNDRASQAVI